MVKPWLGGVLSLDFPMKELMLFGPVFTTETHLAFSSARARSNNTAEMTAMVEALSFHGPHGPVARESNSGVYYDPKHAADVCLGTIQARPHVQLTLARQRWTLCAKLKLRLTMQHDWGTWVMNVLIMPPPLEHSAWCPGSTLQRVRLIVTLVPLLVSVLATTLVEVLAN